MFLSTLCSLLGYHLFSQKVLKIPASASPTFSISCLILIIYGFSLWGKLPFILALLWYLGLILFFLMILLKKNKQDYFAGIILAAFACIFYFGLSGLYFERWDEFSFWGTVSKIIYLTQQLPDQTTNIFYKDYPLANALFQNWFYYGLGQFKEGYAYVAQSILLFAPLLIISELRSKLQALIGLTAFCICLSFFKPSMLSNLSVDSVLATTFSASLMGYALISHRYKMLIFLPTIMLLPLIKQVGLLLAMITTCTIIYLEYRTYRAQKNPSNSLPLILAIVLLPLGIMLVHYSWVAHVQTIQSATTFNMNAINFNSVINHLFLGNETTHKVITNFFYTLLHRGKNLNRLHIATPFLLIGFIACWLKIRTKIQNKNEMHTIDAIHTFLLFGYIIFILGLLVLYLFSFSPYEANILASFSRYSGIYLSAMYFFSISLLFKYMRLPKTRKAQYTCYLLITLTCLALLFSKPSGRLPFPGPQKIMPQILAKNIDKKARIYLIVQNHLTHQLVYKYMLWPRTVNNCASIIPSIASRKYIKTDKYGAALDFYCIIPKEQWVNDLKNFDYLLVSSADEMFWKNYGDIFPTSFRKKHTKISFWKIQKKANKIALLRSL